MSHVNISDDALRAAVENKLGKKTDAPIRVDEMVNINELEVVRSGVCCLTGLEEAKNLTTLRAGGNSVLDLSPLKGINQSEGVRFLGEYYIRSLASGSVD